MDVAVGLAVVSSVITAGILVRREFIGASPATAGSLPPPRKIDRWEQYVPTGRLIGPSSAALTVVEFADFQCPACRELHKLLMLLRVEFPNDLAISYHYFPLPYHKRAYASARAAECAADQGRFTQFHDELYSNFDHLDTVTFERLAAIINIPDMKKFGRCVADTAAVARIDRDRSIAVDTLKASGTPTMLVNGKLYLFAPPLPEFKQMILDARNAKR